MAVSRAFDMADGWKEYRDVIPNFSDTSMQSDMLLEHMNLTKDTTDYLWYTLSFEPNLSCTQPMLHIESLGHVAHAYVNNQHAGAAHGSHNVKGFNLEASITLLDGINNISILSVLVGLPDSGAFLESRFTGLTKVEIQCTNTELYYTLTNSTWGYQVSRSLVKKSSQLDKFRSSCYNLLFRIMQAGLSGESLKIYEDKNSDSGCWSSIDLTSAQPLTWYKTVFDAPLGDDPVALNLSSMGKGEAWVNGQSIGRYWVSFQTANGTASQAMYHIPRSFLKSTGNKLVLLEEFTGDPLQISLVTITATKLDSQTSPASLSNY